MATAATQQQAAPPGRLSQLKREVLRAPKKYMFYGAEGTGKSTLAADAPDPIFLDLDDGTSALSVARYPFRDGPGGHVAQSYPEVRAAVHDLTKSPHAFRTLVIDTVDKLEGMLWTWMIERDQDPSVMKRENPLHQIEDYGYAKGYGRAVDVWREFLVDLDRLRAARGMEVVLLAHAKVQNFKNPEGPDYDRWVPAIDQRAAGALKAWTDITGRVCHEETTKAVEGNKKRHKGLSTGDRVLKLAHSAAFDAKGRGNLPEEIEIPVGSPWAPLAEAIAAGYEEDTAKLTKSIGVELARIGDAELTAKATEAAQAAAKKKDVRTLVSYLNSLRGRPAKDVQS